MKNIYKTNDKKKEKIFRKGVSALILNHEHKLLLVNLQSFETKFYALPGGGIKEGEITHDAIYREIKEELGISKELLDIVGLSEDPIRLTFKTKKIIRNKIEYDGMERFFFGFKFKGNNNAIKLQKEEVRTYAWVAFEDLKKYLLFDNQLEDTTKKLIEIFPFLNKE